MEKAFVVRKVASQLYATEAALDDALLQTTDLVREVMQARRELNVSTLFADEINVKLMSAMQAVTEARTAMLGVHEEMKEAGLRLGLRTTMGALRTTMGGVVIPPTTTGLALSEEMARVEETRKAG
jgi:hypothetical protein